MKFRVGIALVSPLALLSGLLMGSIAPAQVTDPLPTEDSDTAVLSAPVPHRLFAFDPYGASAVVVIDGDDAKLRTLGLVTVARNAGVAMSPDGERLFAAETYWSHGNRGKREDVLTVYDARTLKIVKEILLPGRFIVVPKMQQIGLSQDGRYAYVYDMVPASVVHVVDLDKGEVAQSVDVPGCALSYPFGNDGFSTVCGDGTIGTVSLTNGVASKANFTKQFFDADHDPVFENSVVDRTTGEAWFVSFTGKVYPAKLGAVPQLLKPWSLSAAADLPVPGTGTQELAWRPGGGQLMTMHRATRQLFVLMHAGNHWTHKAEGTEVWVFNVDSQRLVRRIKLDKPARSIVVTQDNDPKLFAFGEGLTVYNPLTGRATGVERKMRGMVGFVKGM